MLKPIKRISIIGSGNVATSISKSIVNKGFTLVQVCSRKIENAQFLIDQLASENNIEATSGFSNLNEDVDCYIVCVSDDAIEGVLQDFPIKDKLIVHTSGSVGMSVFKGFKLCGVFYPLQTFSKENPIAFDGVPLCVEGNSREVVEVLLQFGRQLSNKVEELTSQQREVLHLAAVFACNFSNYMYDVAYDLTSKNKIDFSILLPLINETANKIKNQVPKAAQTGPAKRNDQKIIAKHLTMLENNPNKELYQLITKLIQK